MAPANTVFVMNRGGALFIYQGQSVETNIQVRSSFDTASLIDSIVHVHKYSLPRSTPLRRSQYGLLYAKDGKQQNN